MSKHPQRLKGLQPGSLGLVMAHPWQTESVDVVVGLIEELRGLRDWRDYYEFQRRLVGGLMQTETRFQNASRNAKRVRKGREPLSNPETGDWELDRLVYARVARQLRSVGDALAWKLFNYDRRVVIAVSGNEPPGTMAGKEGLGREIGEVKAAWEHEGIFALLHGTTNCVRVGDVTKFHPGRADLVEVKKDPTKLRREQVQRMERVVATVNERAPMTVEGGPVELLEARQQFKTYLPALRRGLETAQREGHASIRLGSGWVVMISNLNVEGLRTEKDALALLERQQKAKARAFEKAGMHASDHHLRSTRLDGIDLNPSAAPFAIYPFDPVTCALLTCDFLSFESVMTWERLSGSFEAQGFTTRCELPDASGDLNQDTLVISATKNEYTAVLRAAGIEQVLLELVDPRVFAAAVDEVLAVGRDVPAGMFTFANERGTWR